MLVTIVSGAIKQTQGRQGLARSLADKRQNRDNEETGNMGCSVEGEGGKK